MHRKGDGSDRQPRPRGRPREQRADDAILHSALTLFAEGGLASATFDGIAKHSGVSRSTLYRRWRTRDDLLIAALQWSRARAETGLEDWTARHHPELMTIFIRLATRALTDGFSTGLLRHVTALPERSPVRDAYWATIVQPRRDAYAALLAETRRRGDLPAGTEPELLLDQLAGALTYRALVNPAPLDEHEAADYVERLLVSLRLR